MWRLFIFASLYAAYVEGETHYVQTGKDIKIKCGDRSDVVEMVWKHDNTLIFSMNNKSGKRRKGTTGVAKRASSQGNDLRLDNVQSGDKGTYTCTTTDRSGKDTITNHQLEIVNVLVSVNPPSPLLLDSSARLECAVEGLPNPEINWNAAGTEKGTGTVSLAMVKPSDGGKWTCVAKAQGMSFEASLDVHVLGMSGAPDPVIVQQGSSAPLPCSLSTSMGSLHVVGGGWRRMPPASAGPHLPSLNGTTGLSWNSRGTDESKVQFPKGTLGTDLTITLLKVKAEQAGKYECYMEFEGRGTLKAEVTLKVTGGGGSAAGSDSASQPGAPSTNPGKPTPSWLGNMWIWLGVGAGSLVLIMLLVAVVLISQRNKREKRRLRKLRSVRKPLTANDYCQCNRRDRQPDGAGAMNRAARGGLQRPHVPDNIRINGGHGGGRPHV